MRSCPPCAVSEAISPRSPEALSSYCRVGGKSLEFVTMRIVAGFLLIAAASFVLTQSSEELRSRYGEPEMERFAVRPGISLTVDYGSDHLACQALIEPPQSLIHKTEEQTALMSSEGVSEVLEEIAPVAMRGKEIYTAYRVSGCNETRMSDYENVSLSRSTHTCDPSSHDQDVLTAITFKRDICPNQTK
jgi:hypothetical protein